jgi:very-short-patch-repair endonuclease
MATSSVQTAARRLAERQYWVITHGQLLTLGFSPAAVKHWITIGRLHSVWRGVYAAGRRELTREGFFIAAVLACGTGAVLSHESAAILWGIRRQRSHMVEVTVPSRAHPRPPRIKVHRRMKVMVTRHRGIPVTTPTQTLLDLAGVLNAEQYERAVNEAINKDLVDPEELRRTLDGLGPVPGVRSLRALLDRDTYVLTDSELEQRLVPIARRAGLPKPETQVWLNGHRVDFFFRDIGVVVEANSLRFHRTASQQANDSRRTQAHLAAGLLPVPFTHWQITYEPKYVEHTLRAVVDFRPSRSSKERPNSTRRRKP